MDFISFVFLFDDLYESVRFIAATFVFRPLPMVFLLTALLTWMYRKAYNPISGVQPKDLPPDILSTTPFAHRKNLNYRYPFTAFPTGCWFFVLPGADVQPGQVKPLKVLGKDLVIWRGHDGVVTVQDAHCPHLGAHMGYGGTVSRRGTGCLTCPFHGWEFGKDGSCSKIPYNDGVPPKIARITTYAVCERNHLIYIWHGDGDPTYDIPRLAQVDDPNWTLYRQQWRCRTHVQEVVENAVDITHFNVTHAFQSIPQIDLETKGNKFKVRMTALRTFLWIHDYVKLNITYHGMGVVTAEVDSYFLQLRVLLSATPLDREHTEINIFSRFEKTWNPIRNLIYKYYLPYHTGYDFYCDLPIWENKTYRRAPLLVKGDGPIPAIRRWCRQFYNNGKQQLDF